LQKTISNQKLKRYFEMELMEEVSIISKGKIILSTTLLFIGLTAFSQSKPTKNTTRPEIIYKQSHSSNDENSNLFADGIKLKMDMSILNEAAIEREEWNPADIPADDIYGGVWSNSFVNAYGSSINVPDTFLVDLSNFSMPCYGHMTSNFGRRGSRRYHYGVDLKAKKGDTIYAAFDGKIRVKDYERGGYGNYIVIRHINGLETVYGHLSKFLVEENDFVESGQPIGLAGSTGRSTGPHLHFETRFLGRPINPNFIVDFNNKVCHRDEYAVTNSSFKKTTASSRSILKPGETYQVPADNNNSNKYVSGEVQYHRIKKGDTLSGIAKRYGISVKKICNLNNITTKTILRPGKSLRIS
jgi:murein DD-endopeptidase MepM/ murein hydrolase activator NlpD